MSIRAALAAVIGVAGVVALTGCTPTSHADEAAGLRDRLRALPGVEQVRLRYVEPHAFDSADVNLTVTMADDATPGHVAAVASTTYDGFTGAHRSEEGNLVVRYGDDRIRLRGFKPKAEAEDVETAVRTAAELSGRWRRLDAFVMTQGDEVPQAPHVRTTLRLRLPQGTKPAGLRRAKRELRAAYDDDALVRLRVRVARPGI